MAPRGHEKHVTGSGSFGKTGGPVSGGPAGNGSNAGRPGAGGNGSNQQFRPAQPNQTDSQPGNRSIGGGGGGLLIPLLAWLLLGRKQGNAASANGYSASTGRPSLLGKIIRIAVLAIIVILVVKSCSRPARNAFS